MEGCALNALALEEKKHKQNTYMYNLTLVRTRHTHCVLL